MRTLISRGLAVPIVTVAAVLLAGTLPAGASGPARNGRPALGSSAAGLLRAGGNGPDRIRYSYALNGVDVVSRSDGWAVGSFSSAGKFHVLIERWNGRSWKRVAAPALAVSSQLYAVHVVSRNDAWAVGTTRVGFGQTLVLHWNGTAWTQVPSPSPGDNGNWLSAVTGTSAANAWAVGAADFAATGAQILILHWDGTHWAQAAPTSLGFVSWLSAVTAVSGSDGYAVGTYYPTGTSPSERPLILHWNGSSWRRVPAPAPRRSTDTVLSGVSAVSGTEVWSVGYYDTAGHGPVQRTLALRWNGRSWRIVPSPNPARNAFAYLQSVSIASASNGWSAGYYRPGGSTTERSLTEHWNGRSWQIAPSPNGPRGYRTYLQDVSAPSGSNVWSVGYYARDACCPMTRAVILRWNGRSWQPS